MTEYWVITLPIILAYVIISLVLGVYAAKGQLMSRITTWAVASRRIGPIVMFFLTGAGAISAYTFLGAPGWAYSKGVVVCYVIAYLTLGYFVVYLVCPKIWKFGKELDYMTQSSAIGDRYDSHIVGSISAVIGISGCVGYGVTQGMGCGYIFQVASGGKIPFWMGVALAYGVMTVIIAMSGLRAAGWTAVFQGVLMLICSWIAGVLIINHFWGNFGNMFTQLAESAPRLLTLQGGEWSYRYWTTSIIVSALGMLCWPNYWTMWMGADSVKSLRRTISILPLYWFVALPMLCVGWAAVLAMPGVISTDTIAMVMALASIPLGLVGLLFAATLAAAMSSAESLILSASLQCSMDLIKPYARVGEKTVSKLSRILVIPFAAIIVVVSAIQPATIVGMLLMTYGLLVQLFPEIIGMFYWRIGTKWGAIVGLTAGIVVAILCTVLWPDPYEIHAGMWGLMVNAILFVGVSICTKPPKEDVLKVYFPSGKTIEAPEISGGVK